MDRLDDAVRETNFAVALRPNDADYSFCVFTEHFTNHVFKIGSSTAYHGSGAIFWNWDWNIKDACATASKPRRPMR